jgi:hypothetical protein
MLRVGGLDACRPHQTYATSQISVHLKGCRASRHLFVREDERESDFKEQFDARRTTKKTILTKRCKTAMVRLLAS